MPRPEENEEQGRTSGLWPAQSSFLLSTWLLRGGGEGRELVLLSWARSRAGAGLLERRLAARCPVPELEEPTRPVLAPAPPVSPTGAFSLQLWPGPRRPPPGACTTQPQPDRGELLASQYSGLSHEDGASEQPPGVFQAGPSTPGEEPVERSGAWLVSAKGRVCGGMLLVTGSGRPFQRGRRGVVTRESM